MLGKKSLVAEYYDEIVSIILIKLEFSMLNFKKKKHVFMKIRKFQRVGPLFVNEKTGLGFLAMISLVITSYAFCRFFKTQQQ